MATTAQTPSAQAVVCFKCEGSFARALFSKNQMNKPSVSRRCRPCIEKATVVFIAKGKEMGRVVESPVKPQTQSPTKSSSPADKRVAESETKTLSSRPRSQSHSSLSSSSSSSSIDERVIKTITKMKLTRPRSHSYSSAASSSSSSDERVESEIKTTSAEPKSRTQSNSSASSASLTSSDARAKSRTASPTKVAKLSHSSSSAPPVTPATATPSTTAAPASVDQVKTKTASPANVSKLISCSNCKEAQDSKLFSNTQRKKADSVRKCKTCVQVILQQGKQQQPATPQTDDKNTSQPTSATAAAAEEESTIQQPSAKSLSRATTTETPMFGPALPPSTMVQRKDEDEDYSKQKRVLDKKRAKLKLPKDDDSDVPESHTSPVSVLDLEDSLARNSPQNKKARTAVAQEATKATSGKQTAQAASSKDVDKDTTRQEQTNTENSKDNNKDDDKKGSQKGALTVLSKIKRAVAKRIDKIHRLVDMLCSRQPPPSPEQVKTQVHEDIGGMRKTLSNLVNKVTNKYNNGEPPCAQAKELLETGLPPTQKVVQITMNKLLAKLKLQQAKPKTKKRRADDAEAEKEEGQDKTKKKKKKSDGKCDKCDGPHEAIACPHYNKPRGSHQDARPGGVQGGLGASGGNMRMPHAREISMPGDGSCLFHSMAHGLRGQESLSAFQLRRQLVRWIGNNPNLKISGTPIKEWVRWDSGVNLRAYTGRMAQGGWGGGIEMAACSALFRCNVHVYEESRRHGGFKRISCFDYSKTARTVHVVYQGGCHYNALVPKGDLVQDATEGRAGGHKNKSAGMKRAFGAVRKDKGYGGKRHRSDQMQQQQQSFHGANNKKGNAFNRGRRSLVKKNIKGRKRSFSR